MASPLTVKRNDYNARPKRSDVYTPVGVASFLFDTLRFAERSHRTVMCETTACIMTAPQSLSPSLTPRLGPAA